MLIAKAARLHFLFLFSFIGEIYIVEVVHGCCSITENDRTNSINNKLEKQNSCFPSKHKNSFALNHPVQLNNLMTPGFC